MALKINVHEDNGKTPKFTYGEQVGVQGFFSASSVSLKRYSDEQAKFGYGSDRVLVRPNGTHDGLLITVTADESVRFATPNMDFEVKYSGTGNEKDMCITVLNDVLDMLDGRKTTVDGLRILGVIA